MMTEMMITDHRHDVFRAKNEMFLAIAAQKNMYFLHRFCANFVQINNDIIYRFLQKSGAEIMRKMQNKVQKHLVFCTTFCTNMASFSA
jgi:hypothetical protein